MQYSVSVETWEQVPLLDVGQGLSKCVMRNDVLRPAAGRVVVAAARQWARDYQWRVCRCRCRENQQNECGENSRGRETKEEAQ
jgi:hypothetical protein